MHDRGRDFDLIPFTDLQDMNGGFISSSQSKENTRHNHSFLFFVA